MKFTKKVIDAHYHIYDVYAEGANCFDNTKRFLDVRNFSTININAMPSVDTDVRNNILSAFTKIYYPQCYSHGGITYESYPVPESVKEEYSPLTQYNEILEIGFDGIKMLETKPTHQKVIGRTVDEPLYRDFFDRAEADGTHFVWHVNDPDTFWDAKRIPPKFIEYGWFYGDGTYLSHEKIYETALKVLEEHPKLNVTFAHFFFMSGKPEILQEIFDKYPNVSVDLTPGSEMYNDFGKRYDFYKDFFTRNANRIVYGTDCADRKTDLRNSTLADIVYEFVTTDKDFDMWDYRFRGLGLPDDVCDKILAGNFIRFVGGDQKPINKPALAKYIDKYKHLITEKEAREFIEKEAEKLL